MRKRVLDKCHVPVIAELGVDPPWDISWHGMARVMLREQDQLPGSAVKRCLLEGSWLQLLLISADPWHLSPMFLRRGQQLPSLPAVPAVGIYMCVPWQGVCRCGSDTAAD